MMQQQQQYQQQLAAHPETAAISKALLAGWLAVKKQDSQGFGRGASATIYHFCVMRQLWWRETLAEECCLQCWKSPERERGGAEEREREREREGESGTERDRERENEREREQVSERERQRREREETTCCHKMQLWGFGSRRQNCMTITIMSITTAS